ncbi:hypothetical protein [Croceimicrobium hydrocarbonivorans]|uniref:Uncharacterized protein n=1 Tax=Croceimicrobium hydrocarbonivorans TaxID=2761580 RepID=A0A7H0VDQ9_9FLAO|nr:hypothetical protein [Croceimicrobium hydrocarbonivorans]QNR23857.1 hypothetical protein H4K34_15995 [Croceimicrobium hydrocarbonivorans]
MKIRFIILFVTLISSSLIASELNKDMVALAEIYRSFMFRNNPTESSLKEIDHIESVELEGSKAFIKECISSENKLTDAQFLSLPDESTMKYIYIIRRINWNLREAEPRNNDTLISELSNRSIQRYELIDNYYDMLFTGIGNKNQPFDLSELDFKINEYKLQDNTEKGIFFLKAMDLCGTSIWGYMNIVKPPNYKKALAFIEKFPKFNGQPYYQYLDFSFKDFEMQIEEGKDPESYKAYYINKYYDCLLSHLACLSQKKRQKEERMDLLLGSILNESNYYPYSQKKEVLESLFTKAKR